VALVREVARLCRRPYRSLARLRRAHALLRLHAADQGTPEIWADLVLLEFLGRGE
jgi:hypothetical protein